MLNNIKQFNILFDIIFIGDFIVENILRVIHTSDWHIGHMLYEKKRYDEFEDFFVWLNDRILELKPDILLVAGDVFHTAAPSSTAQKIYYNFLANAEKNGCKNVVITGGNHDSPILLDAPKEILKYMNVFVCGSATENIEDEVFVIKNDEGKDIAIVCAVPFLRDRDLRTAFAGESSDDKDKKLLEGLKNHYIAVAQRAKELNKCNVPVIAMGHLYAAGAESVKEDELEIGSLGQVGADIFPDYFDYVALGHLHIPQKVNQNERIRYSGSPLPVSFDEIKSKKQIIEIDFKGKDLDIKAIEVPKFRKIIRLKGSLTEVLEKLEVEKQSDLQVWADVTITSDEGATNINFSIDECIKGSNVEVLAKHPPKSEITINEGERKDVDALNIKDVFQMRLDKTNLNDEIKKELWETFNEALSCYKNDEEEF